MMLYYDMILSLRIQLNKFPLSLFSSDISTVLVIESIIDDLGYFIM